MAAPARATRLTVWHKPIRAVPLFFPPCVDQLIIELGPAIGPGGPGYTGTEWMDAKEGVGCIMAAAQAGTPPAPIPPIPLLAAAVAGTISAPVITASSMSLFMSLLLFGCPEASYLNRRNTNARRAPNANGPPYVRRPPSHVLLALETQCLGR